MLAMQYEVTLPSDYDMAIIDERIKTRGPLLDEYPGLGLKAYAVRNRARGATVNQYAPVYLWHEEDAMARFLAGDGFRGLCESFGRPAVRHWIGLVYERGPSHATAPREATRQTLHLDPESDLRRDIAEAEADTRRARETADLHSVALALDPKSWQLVRFSFWDKSALDGDEVSYEVRHVSAPMLDRL